MKSLISLLTILFVTCTLSPDGYSQVSGRLTGYLVDEQDTPIGYANVAVLVANDNSLVTGAVSDADGSFTVKTPAPGIYHLRISAIGYTEYKSPTFEVPADTFSKDFGRLKLHEGIETLKEVKVQALRPTVTLEADRMVLSVEGTALAAGSTAYDILAKAPGVFIDQEGNIQLNGKAGVSIMIDGRLTYLSAKDLRSMLEGMSAENIRNIEIITNPSAKHDAEGSSGILNINLKKYEQRGTNGSLYSGYKFNGLHTYSNGGDLSFRKGRLSAFAQVDVARRAHQRTGEFIREFNSSASSTLFDQQVREDVVQFAPSMRVGADMDINSKSSVGFMLNLAYQKTRYDFYTGTYITNDLGLQDLFIDAVNSTVNKHKNKSLNLHYLANLDTLGSTLSADLDLVRLGSKGNSSFNNQYDSLALGKEDYVSFLSSENPTAYEIYAGKVDYSRAMAGGRVLALGAKISSTSSNNDLRFYTEAGEGKTLDQSRSNHFIYKENIYAAYASLKTKLGDRISLQAGLRAEQTVSEGKSITTEELTERKYLNLFPSLFIQQQLSENYQINYNYSRRIQRPDYELLNPFKYYLDPYTWAQGNPYLQPMYTHSFAVVQSFMKSYNLELNYSLTKDFIAEVPLQNTEDKITIFNRDNVDVSQSLSASFAAPLKILKNWESNNHASLSWQYFAMGLNGQKVENEQISYMAQSKHNILLPHNFRVEINATYVGPQVWALYKFKPQWWLDLGVKKSFFDDKLDLSLSLNDIFRTRRMIGNVNLEGNTNHLNQYFSSQSIALNLRYRFSKGEKFNNLNRNSRLEELERAGGN